MIDLFFVIFVFSQVFENLMQLYNTPLRQEGGGRTVMILGMPVLGII
jgi:hypothetical protein